jgi:hypothetical protein
MLVTVAVFNSLVEAKMAEGLLREHDIESFVFDEYMGGFYPLAVGGFRLQVSDHDFEKAKVILELK